MVAMKIKALEKYQKRHDPGCYFEELPPDVRARARWWLTRLEERRRQRGRPRSPWLFALYVGQAKRLALHPPSSAWGRSMRAKKGGLAVQQKYRWEGRNRSATGASMARAEKPVGSQRAEGARPPATRPRLLPPFNPVTVLAGKVYPGRM